MREFLDDRLWLPVNETVRIKSTVVNHELHFPKRQPEEVVMIENVVAVNTVGGLTNFTLVYRSGEVERIVDYAGTVASDAPTHFTGRIYLYQQDTLFLLAGGLAVNEIVYVSFFGRKYKFSK